MSLLPSNYTKIIMSWAQPPPSLPPLLKSQPPVVIKFSDLPIFLENDHRLLFLCDLVRTKVRVVNVETSKIISWAIAGRVGFARTKITVLHDNRLRWNQFEFWELISGGNGTARITELLFGAWISWWRGGERNVGSLHRVRCQETPTRSAAYRENDGTRYSK